MYAALSYECSATSVCGLKLLVYEALSCDVLQARVEELSRVEHALRADLSTKEQEAQRLQQQVGEGARVELSMRYVVASRSSFSIHIYSCIHMYTHTHTCVCVCVCVYLYV